jgi:hypothetical protein
MPHEAGHYSAPSWGAPLGSDALEFFGEEGAYDPYEQFQRRMYSEMLPRTGAVGTRPWQRLETAAGRGFAPAFGEWILSQAPPESPFYDPVTVEGSAAPTFGKWYDARRQPAYEPLGDPRTAFQNLAALSATYGGSGVLTEAEQAARLASPYAEYLDPATREARGITSYMLGGPTRGYLGQLNQRRAQRLSDLFGRLQMQQGSDVYGRPAESYFDWLQGVLPGYAPPPVAAGDGAVAAGDGAGAAVRTPVSGPIWKTNPGSEGVWYQAFQAGVDRDVIRKGLSNIGVNPEDTLLRWSQIPDEEIIP